MRRWSTSSEDVGEVLARILYQRVIKKICTRDIRVLSHSRAWLIGSKHFSHPAKKMNGHSIARCWTRHVPSAEETTKVQQTIIITLKLIGKGQEIYYFLKVETSSVFTPDGQVVNQRGKNNIVEDSVNS